MVLFISCISVLRAQTSDFFLFESILPLIGHDSVVPNHLQIILHKPSYSRRQVCARVVKSEGL
jgi:hypothetical protein